MNVKKCEDANKNEKKIYYYYNRKCITKYIINENSTDMFFNNFLKREFQIILTILNHLIILIFIVILVYLILLKKY